MTSSDAIFLSYKRKTNNLCPLIADIAETLSRIPVTVAVGVFPQGAQVLPRNAVKDTLDSSWKYKIALFSATQRLILGIS